MGGNENALEGIVRIGTVTDADPDLCRVRVKFQSEGYTSGWLRVLQRAGTELSITPDAEHTHDISDTYTGGGSAGTYPAHEHPLSTAERWMPEINETVLCLYLPVFNGDGFVLGTL